MSTPTIRKITASDPLAASADVVAENIAKLKTLFPELITEGEKGASINVDVLKQLVGDQTLTDAEEKFGLNWYGKRQARQLALTPSTGTLRPCPDESVDWDSTQNIFIEGDNLEVLKLLQKSYAGQVKLIYIDPPYNTGKDFVYPDDFSDGIGNYLARTGQVDSEGLKNSSNTESSGRFHTAWLSMILPRVRLARSFLRPDGAIFISCDEAEHPRLRSLMDDVFGEENFVADFVWAAGRKNDSRLVSISHEYIVCYARDSGHLKAAEVEWRQRKKGLDDIYAQHERLRREHGSDYSAMTAGLKQWFKGLADGHPAKAHKHYCHVDARGVFFPADISWPGGGGPTYEVRHPATRKPVKVPARGWITPDPKKMQRWIEEDRVQFGEDESKVPCLKAYLKDQEYQAPYSVFYQDGRAATKRLRELMDADCFDFPKDELVLQELIAMMTGEGDLVMDFFAGSGTTGHAVMLQNREDRKRRRFILVQLPEPLDPDKEVQAEAAALCDKLKRPRNIATLTKERLKRAGRVVADGQLGAAMDVGYRTFRLDYSCMRRWNSSAMLTGDSLESSVDHIEPGRTSSDLLHELLLKRGLDLCVPIESKTIAGKKVQSVGAGSLIACLDTRITRTDGEGLALGIAMWHKELNPAGETAVVFRDDAFADDVVKTNVAAILEQHGLKNVRSL